MSKVLFLVNSDIVVYNFRLELVERLLADGHQVVISSPYGERIEDLKLLGCEYRLTEMSRHGMNPMKDLLLLLEYKKLLKEIKPDIVFSYTIKPNIYGAIACRRWKIPCVANITGLGTAVENSSFIQKIIILLYRYAFRQIQKVYFQNTENKQFFIDHKIKIRKQELLPGSGVNLQRFSVLQYPSDAHKEFAFISRIMKEKGIDQYLAAAEYIHEKYPDTIFHICGFCEQAYEERLKELQDKNIIVYHGMVRDIKAILKDVHCVVHPTYYPEGLSNILLEACACGRPIITTDRSGCREVIDDGINGFVVKQQDSENLIEKLEQFMALSWVERRNMGLAGRKKVEQKFDRNIVVNAYLRDIDAIERI